MLTITLGCDATPEDFNTAYQMIDHFKELVLSDWSAEAMQQKLDLDTAGATPTIPFGVPGTAAAVPSPTAQQAAPAFSPPSPPAPIPAAPPAPPAPSVDVPTVDAKGHPWDERIHSSSKSLNADGTWRYKRGVNPALIQSIEGGTTQPAPAPAPVVTLHGDLAKSPPAPPAPAPAPPAPAQPSTAPMTSAEFMRKVISMINTSGGKLNTAIVNEVCAAMTPPKANLPQCAADPATHAMMITMLEAYL